MNKVIIAKKVIGGPSFVVCYEHQTHLWFDLLCIGSQGLV